jgi:hypothetical protein
MMDEHLTSPQTSPAASPEIGSLDQTSPGSSETQQTAKNTAPISLNPGSKSRPVLLYMGIMFSVALILLLLSFLMQQRNHEALMEGLTDLSDLQSMVDLKMENQTLQESLAQSKLDLATLQAEYESMTAQKNTASAQTTAMEYLAEIQHAYDLDHRKTARALIAVFESTGLSESLPDTSAVEGGTSPAQVFLDIKEDLF